MIISNRLRWAGQIARMGDRKIAYMISVVRPGGNKPLARPINRGEDNIKMDFQEVGWGGMDWIALVWVRGRWWGLVNAVMNLRVP